MVATEMQRLHASLDQTLLKPTVGFAEASEWMEACEGKGFATLCVSPFLVPLAAQRLAGTATEVCSVVGVPAGLLPHRDQGRGGRASRATRVRRGRHGDERRCLS